MMARFSFIIILLLSLLTISCAKDKPHLLNNDIKRSRTSFSYIVVLKEGLKIGNASGVLISHDIYHSYVLTAGHVCNNPKNNFEVVDYLGKTYKTKLEKIEYKNDSDKKQLDLCLLKTNKRMPHVAIKVSEHDLEWGEKVWNLNAAATDFFPKTAKNPHGLIQVDEGRFSGFDEDVQKYVFKVFGTMPGSSGSMILNHRGHLVSMVVSFRWFRKSPGFITYGMPLKEIRNFLRGYNLR